MKIIADDKIPFLKGALESFAEINYVPGNLITREIAKDADALLIRTRTKCSANLLEGTRIKFIGTATIGFDHIDTNFCDSHKIRWTNAPGCNSSSVQQYFTSAILKLEHEYSYNLRDKTIGIIGVGNVGSKIEKAARLLGMKVLLNDPPRARIEGDTKFVPLDIVLSASDIITVHVPLNVNGIDKTWHLFNEENFDKMKTGAWFFNTSRGEVADTNAVNKALISGKIAGAVIDVWENEPDIDLELMTNCFITTPHIAGYSTDGKANGTSMIVNSLSRYFNLPVENWYPGNVPIPSVSEISIDGKHRSDYDIIREAVFHSYNIEEDDTHLRADPADFEKLRGNYSLRREFTSYKINLINGSEEARKMLDGLGFKMK
jgi:erythronate-4-phosphate dehydrogenase